MDTFRPGITPSEYPPVTQLLLRKSPKPYNILVGEVQFQIRFAEQILGLKCRNMESVTDADLLTGEPCLLSVTTTRVVDISEGTKNKTATWSIGPIGKGSAAALAIVRHAASVVKGGVPDKDVLQAVADELTKDGVDDIRVAIWRAVNLLLGPVPERSARWLEPWESCTGWLRPDIEPSYRLNTLFKDLSAYVFLSNEEEGSLRKAGINVSPSKAKYLSSLKLPAHRVHDTLVELSSWRMRQDDPLLCAIKISALWQGG